MIHDDRSDSDVLLGDVTRLENVLSRDSATRVARSFFQLFRLPVRVISAEGTLVADVHRDQPLWSYQNTSEEGASRCGATVADARNLETASNTVIHPCFTGAVYRIVPLIYQGRTIGRVIVGPYVPSDSDGPPTTLLSVHGGLDPDTLRAHHAQMPRVRADVAERLCDHLEGVFELLVFAGHRAQLASTMQVASVRESYRELALKNEALQQSYEDLKQLDKLKSTFLATVSHELRTPLTSIIGYAEMLESGAAGALSDGQARYMQTIRGKADELLGLISSLLDLGRLEAKNMELEREAVDSRALLAGVASTVVPAANRRNVSLEVAVDEATPKLWGDPIRLRQILVNLADNAVKFTDPGGTVSLAARAGELELGGPEGLGAALFDATKPAVILEVRDTGIGMAEDQVARVFDAFYQIDGGTTRSHGGAGLGLSIVKQLVEVHEGRIEVTSEPGTGTLVTVMIPAIDDDA